MKQESKIRKFWFRKLPFPLSVNHLRFPMIVGKRVMPIKTKEYRLYEEEMLAAVIPQKQTLKNEPQALYAFLYAPEKLWMTKERKAQRIDIDNYAKSLIDALCKALSFDDKWFFEVHLYKAIGTKRSEVYIINKLTSSLDLLPS